MNKYQVKCSMCGQRWELALNNDQYGRLFEYRGKGRPIQEVLSDLNPVEREFIKSEMCPECQEKIFGNGETNKIKKIKD